MEPADSTKRLEVEVKRHSSSPRVQGGGEGSASAHNLVRVGGGRQPAKGRAGLLWTVGVWVCSSIHLVNLEPPSFALEFESTAVHSASPEVSYVGSKVDHEGAFPTGLRHRVIEAPLGSKLGYHELDDEKEDADEEWMLGEASSLSGAGSRGSKNWVLKVMVPILLIVGIICMHQWWTDIKEGASAAIDAVGDAFDRRALQEETKTKGGQGAAVGGGQEAVLEKRGGAAAGEERQARFSDKTVYSVQLDGGDAAAETQA